jgi:hypothetical protein
MSATEILVEVAAAAALLASAASAHAAGQKTAPGARWVVSIRGEAANLSALERAGRRCGVRPLTRHRDVGGEWLEIRLGDRPGRDDGLTCLRAWVRAHPEAGVTGFLANLPVQK